MSSFREANAWVPLNPLNILHTTEDKIREESEVIAGGTTFLEATADLLTSLDRKGLINNDSSITVYYVHDEDYKFFLSKDIVPSQDTKRIVKYNARKSR